MCAGADANDADMNGHTPLLEAVMCRDAEVAQVLLDYGAEPNVADSEGFTPLYRAAGPGGNRQLVKLLLERGALVDGASEYGWTPLRTAANLGRRDVVKVLLDNGADPFKRANDGSSPFSAAATWMPEMKQMLVAATVSRARNQIIRLIRQSNGTRTQPYTIRILHKRQS